MNKSWYRFARLALALGGAAACWTCNAPFIPVPPPGQTATFTSSLVSDGAGGQKTAWIAHGPPNMDAAFARFLIFNTNRTIGVIAEAGTDGSFTSPPMDGTEGDRVEISFETTTGALSIDVCFVLTTNTVPKDSGPSAPRCP